MTRCDLCHCVGRHLNGCPHYHEMTTSWHEHEVSLVNVVSRWNHGNLEWKLTREPVLKAENDLVVEDALHEELKRIEGEER